MRVYIHLPTAGTVSRLLLASGLTDRQAGVIKDHAVWSVDIEEEPCVECAEPQPTGTGPFVPPVGISLTPATEYFAWVQLPPLNGKLPWSMFADRITPDEAEVFRTNLHRRVSVQPMPDKKV